MSVVITRELQSTADIARQLADELGVALEKGMRVFWLISGGSSLPIAVTALQLLHFDVGQLAITLVDDKFLPLESPDSNAAKLHSLGFMPGAAEYQPILCGENLDRTTELFGRYLEKQLAWADFTLGQFGLGEGYHTGGILPHSPAAEMVDKLACGYTQDGAGHVTVAPGLIKKLDVAFINSTGEAKRPLVEHFLTSVSSITDEPTQALKLAQKIVLVSDVLLTRA